MSRDKNPSIPHDAKNRYNRTTLLSGHNSAVCIEYDACLVDSEDVDLISVTDADGDGCPDLCADVQRRLDEVHSLLRAELAEYADYVEAHR